MRCGRGRPCRTRLRSTTLRRNFVTTACANASHVATCAHVATRPFLALAAGVRASLRHAQRRGARRAGRCPHPAGRGGAGRSPSAVRRVLRLCLGNRRRPYRRWCRRYSCTRVAVRLARHGARARAAEMREAAARTKQKCARARVRACGARVSVCVCCVPACVVQCGLGWVGQTLGCVADEFRSCKVCVLGSTPQPHLRRDSRHVSLSVRALRNLACRRTHGANGASCGLACMRRIFCCMAHAMRFVARCPLHAMLCAALQSDLPFGVQACRRSTRGCGVRRGTCTKRRASLAPLRRA